MQGIDASLFLALNGLAGSSPAFDAVAIFCASVLIFVMAAAGIARALWLWYRRDPIAPVAISGIPRAAAAAGVGFLANQLSAAYAWFRARPYVDIPAAHRLIAEPVTPQSFPSGHATVAFAIAFTSLFVDPKCGRWMLAGAVLVALGRVTVGVHYPLDVLAGAAAGLFWALVARAIGRRLKDTELMKRLFIRS